MVADQIETEEGEEEEDDDWDYVAPCVIYLNCDTPLCDGKDCGGGGGEGGRDDRRDAEGILWAAAARDFRTRKEEGGRKGDAPSGESDADADGRTDELMM